MKNKVKLERPFLLAVCLLSSIMLNAQPTLQWQKCIGGTNDENAPSIVETPDGGYITAGYTSSTDGDVVYPSNQFRSPESLSAGLSALEDSAAHSTSVL